MMSSLFDDKNNLNNYKTMAASPDWLEKIIIIKKQFWLKLIGRELKLPAWREDV